MQGAGTDADVTIRLYGTEGETGLIRLPALPEHFERGSSDAFVVKGRHVGTPSMLDIGHDGKVRK